MEKLQSLSKPVSHTPAAEDWDAGTHFPSLEIINPLPGPDFPQNSNSRLLVPAEHRQSTSEDCTGPYKAWSAQEGTRNLPSPKGAGSKHRAHREGAQLNVQWCPEGQLGMLRTKSTTSAPWALGGTAQGAGTHDETQNDWMETKPKRIQSPQLRITDVGVGIVHLPAFSGGLHLFVSADNSLEVPGCCSVLSLP